MSGAPPRTLLVVPPVHVAAEHIDYPELMSVGMVQLAAELRRGGQTVHVLDALSRPESGAFPQRGGGWLVGAPWGVLRAPIEGAPFDLALVHLAPWATYRARVHGLADLVTALRRARPRARIGLVEAYVGGMHHVEVDGDALLASYPEADFFVPHEAETTLAGLAGGAAPGEAPGAWRELAGVVPGEPATDLDALATPAWELVDGAAYDRFLGRYYAATRRSNAFRVGPGSRPVLLSRGCPYRCAFCTSGPPAAGPRGKAYRPLGLDRVEALLDDLTAHGARHVVVLDDAANVRPDFKPLLEALLRRELSFDFPNGLRADHLDREAVELLVRGGAVVSVSAESGSPEVLARVVHKRLDLAAVERAAAWCREAGGRSVIHWIVGLPGEGREDAARTLAEARRLLDTWDAAPLVQYAAPIPGAALSPEPAAPGTFVDPGLATARGPTWLPEGATRDELVAGVELLRERARKAEPDKVIVNVTYQCNNHCRFCAVGNRIKAHLPLADIQERLRAHRRAGIELLDIDGGEPTLHPELIELVRWSRAEGFRVVNVTTNGRVLAYEKAARALMRSGLTELLVSLHGPTAEVHDALTSVPGSFAQTTQGLANAIRLAPEGVSVGVNTTLARGNMGHLLEVAELVESLGARRLNVQFLTPFGRADRELAPDPRQAAPILRRLVDGFGDRLLLQIINLPYCFLPGYERTLASDLGKLARTMIFVTREEVNLFEYLATTRVRDEACERCLMTAGCDGRYSFAGPSHD